MNITISLEQAVGAVVALFGFQAVAIRAFWKKHEEWLEARLNPIQHLENAIEKDREDQKKEARKMRERIHSLELALSRKGILIRGRRDDDDEEADA